MNDTQHATSFMESVGWPGIVFAIFVVVVACLIIGYVHRERLASWRRSRSDSNLADTPGANPTIPTPGEAHAPAASHAAGHDDDHAHGHGPSFFDWFFIVIVGSAVLGLIFFPWWNFGSSSDAPKTSGRSTSSIIFSSPQPGANQAIDSTRAEIEATRYNITAHDEKWETIKWIHVPDSYVLHINPGPLSGIVELECVMNVEEPPSNSGTPDGTPEEKCPPFFHWFRVRSGPASMGDDGKLTDQPVSYWFTFSDKPIAH